MGVLQRGASYEHAALVRGLSQPAAYPHPVSVITHLETHISHVFLAGELAYKIKKPLELGFLDFSTLDKRHYFCEEELRINRRLAPDLYLAVVPITGSEQAPRVEGDGPAIEYAVKMRRFAQDGLLERVLERGALSPALIDELAAQVACFSAPIEVLRACSGATTRRPRRLGRQPRRAGASAAQRGTARARGAGNQRMLRYTDIDAEQIRKRAQHLLGAQASPDSNGGNP